MCLPQSDRFVCGVYRRVARRLGSREPAYDALEARRGGSLQEDVAAARLTAVFFCEPVSPTLVALIPTGEGSPMLIGMMQSYDSLFSGAYSFDCAATPGPEQLFSREAFVRKAAVGKGCCRIMQVVGWFK